MGFGDTGAAERRAARKREREALEKQKAEDELKEAQDAIAKTTKKEKDILATEDYTIEEDEDALSDVRPVNMGELRDKEDFGRSLLVKKEKKPTKKRKK